MGHRRPFPVQERKSLLGYSEICEKPTTTNLPPARVQPKHTGTLLPAEMCHKKKAKGARTLPLIYRAVWTLASVLRERRVVGDLSRAPEATRWHSPVPLLAREPSTNVLVFTDQEGAPS